MSRLLLPNLLTDQTYLDPHPLGAIFPAHPAQGMFLSRLTEEMGAWLLANANGGVIEFIVLPYELPEMVRSLASERGLRLPNVVKIDSHPGHADAFAAELATALNRLPQITSVECAGWGLAEEKLRELLKPRKIEVYPAGWTKLDNMSASSFDFFSLSKELNAKTFLPRVAAQLSLEIPPSRVVQTNEILNPDFSKDYVFKSDFSSGGSGVLTMDDGARRLLGRALREDESLKNATWLMQRRVAVRREYSAVVWTNHSGASENNMNVSLLEVEYDKARLSRLHRSLHPSESKLRSRLLEVARVLAEFLFKKGWLGPFGFDSILDESGSLYDVTDLNVRMTKGHFLTAAVKALGCEQRNWSIERVRCARSLFQSEMEFRRERPSATILSCGGALESGVGTRAVCEWTELKFTDRAEAEHAAE